VSGTHQLLHRAHTRDAEWCYFDIKLGQRVGQRIVSTNLSLQLNQMLEIVLDHSKS